MWGGPNLINYREFLNSWETESQKWISINNFKENEINMFMSGILSYPPENSLTNCLTVIHDLSNNDRINVLYDIFRQKRDTLPNLIFSFLLKDPSSMVRRECAGLLKFYSYNEAYDLLKIFTIDSCQFVRLEAALSLSYLGEQTISFDILSGLWANNDPIISMDNYPYFTVGMRNIMNEKSFEFLKEIFTGDNPYSALDASICLLQCDKKEEFLNGIRIVLKMNNTKLFYNGAILLIKYLPFDVAKAELWPFLRNSNNDIAEFSKFIISSVQNK